MMMRSSLLIVSVFITAGTPAATSTAAMAMHHHTPDVRELLVSARGVAPAVCLLAGDGVASTGRWGGGFWDAPAMSIGAEVRMRVREMMRSPLTSEDERALLDALGSNDACIRHLASTIIGRSDEKAFVGPLTAKIEAAS